MITYACSIILNQMHTMLGLEIINLVMILELDKNGLC